MQFPAFFDAVVEIAVCDPLAALLGAAEDGRIAYRYADAVKLAGHSCPTVAGAWLMTARALAQLYPDELPQRGDIRVQLRGALEDGTTGVTASVIGMVTGAAGAGGFKGIAGRHDRRNLLVFGAPIDPQLRFTRLDTQRSVAVTYHPDCVPMSPGLKAQLVHATAANADAAARTDFAQARQGWVRTILIDHRDDPSLIELTG